MSRLPRVWSFGIRALTVCLLVTPLTRSADDDEDDVKEAGKAAAPLKKLVDAVAEGNDKDLAGLTKGLNDKTDLKHIMWAAYKPRSKGGLGVGEKAGAITPDGIDAKLDRIVEKGLPQTQLTRESVGLIRLGQVALALAEVVDMNAPAMGNPKKQPEKWAALNKEQREGAKEFIDAVKASDPAKVKAAATRLRSSCTTCHGIFRDQ